MNAMEAMQIALEDELGLATTHRMLRAFGGRTQCLDRFLISRQYDVCAAAEAFRSTAAFRRSHGLDGEVPYNVPEELKGRMAALWPTSFCGSTVDDAPIQLWQMREVDIAAIMEVPEAEFTAYYIWWMERSLALQAEALERDPTVESGLCDVYDCSGMSVAALTYMAGRSGFALLSRVLSIGKQYYPENLRRALIINAPLGFASAWSLVSPLLSERTLTKFDIRSDDGTEPLLELLGGKGALQTVREALGEPPKSSSWGEWAGGKLSYVMG